jgi:alpha-1,3/alpha-1,6-mannosyltransferase
VYSKAFPSLSKRPPRVVYPCVDIEQCQSTKWRKGKGKAVGKDDGVDLIES